MMVGLAEEEEEEEKEEKEEKEEEEEEEEKRGMGLGRPSAISHRRP